MCLHITEDSPQEFFFQLSCRWRKKNSVYVLVIGFFLYLLWTLHDMQITQGRKDAEVRGYIYTVELILSSDYQATWIYKNILSRVTWAKHRFKENISENIYDVLIFLDSVYCLPGHFFLLLSQMNSDWSILSFWFLVLQAWSETLLIQEKIGIQRSIGENHLSNTQLYIWISGPLVHKQYSRYQRAMGSLKGTWSLART